jgi:hypothetical protein
MALIVLVIVRLIFVRARRLRHGDGRHRRGRLLRALERGNLRVAEATARELSSFETLAG